MKITLKQRLALKSAIVYLKLKMDVEREDIKNYLNSSHGGFSNEIVEKRVQNYLKELGIYDKNYKLTSKGQTTKESGLVEEHEEGKYQIWYTKGDHVFGSRIFHFERVSPELSNKQDLKSLEIETDSDSFISLPVSEEGNKKNFIDFSIMSSLREAMGEEISNTDYIEYDWIWDGIENTNFIFSGKLKTAVKNKKNSLDNEQSIDSANYGIILKQHILKIIPNWNCETKRCKMKLENVRSGDDVKSNDRLSYFKYSGSLSSDNYNSSEYGSREFENLPIEPYNLEEAHEWRNSLLNMELEKRYITPNEFSEFVINTNDKEGFEAYKSQLDVPETERYIKKLDTDRKSARSKAYWHLAAPFDLNCAKGDIK